ncbi:hypothetical protein MHYP_G00094870 [Metynnis hypsauchen]
MLDTETFTPRDFETHLAVRPMPTKGRRDAESSCMALSGTGISAAWHCSWEINGIQAWSLERIDTSTSRNRTGYTTQGLQIHFEYKTVDFTHKAP